MDATKAVDGAADAAAGGTAAGPGEAVTGASSGADTGASSGAATGADAVRTVSFTLAPPQPFRLDLTAMALQRRRNNRIDVWDGTTYRRVMPATASGGALAAPFLLEVTAEPRAEVRAETTGETTAVAVGQARTEATGEVRGEPTNEADGARTPFPARLRIAVTTAGASAEAMREGGERAARDLLGLDVDLSEFYALAAQDPHLATLAERLRGLKPPRYPGLFEGLLNAVPCQQVTLTFGLQLVARMAEAYGPRLPFASRTAEAGPMALPTPGLLAAAEVDALGAMGFSRAKARALVELAGKVTSGELDVAGIATAEDAAVMERLGGLFGIGRWTSEYVLLRALGRLGVFPHGDSGARNGLARFLGEEGKPSYAWVAERVAGWQPYAGFVYLHLLVDGATRADAAGELHAPSATG